MADIGNDLNQQLYDRQKSLLDSTDAAVAMTQRLSEAMKSASEGTEVTTASGRTTAAGFAELEKNLSAVTALTFAEIKAMKQKGALTKEEIRGRISAQKESVKLARAQQENFKIQQKIQAQSDKFVGALKNMSASITKFIPIVGEHLQKKLDGIFDKLASRMDTVVKKMLMGKGGGFSTGKMLGLGAALGAVTLIAKQFVEIEKVSINISKQTGLTGKNLETIRGAVISAQSSSYALGISMGETADSAAALVTHMSNFRKVSADLIKTTAVISKFAGIGAEEAGKFVSTLSKGFGMTQPQIKDFSDRMKNFATSTGVNARKVIQDIASNTNLTSIYLSRGEDYLKKAAVQAQKLNMSMGELDSATKSFMDIEGATDIVADINMFTGSSINALEMFNLSMKKDTVGIAKRLGAAFNSPQGLARIEEFPGWAEKVAGQFGMTLEQVRKLGKPLTEAEQEAEAMAKALEKQQTTWGEVSNRLKGVLLPIVNKVALKILDIVKSVRNWAGDSSDANSNFNKIKNTLGDVWEIVKGIGSGLKTAWDFSKGLMESIGLTDGVKQIGALGGTITAIAGAIKIWSKIKTRSPSGNQRDPLWVQIKGMLPGMGGGGVGSGNLVGGQRVPDRYKEQKQPGKLRRAAGWMGRSRVGRGVAGAASAAAGMIPTGMGSKAVSMIGSGLKKTAGVASAAKGLLGKTALKSVLKKIPIVGLAAGAFFAYQRMKGGDYLGGILELGSGIASLFPGIGTGVSVALDAGLMARDVAGATPAAKGAMVDSPTLFMAGEEGLPEMIVPVGRMARGMPIDAGVADALGGMGVPGYARGTVKVSAAGRSGMQRTQQRAQDQVVIQSQADPAAQKRLQQEQEIKMDQEKQEQKQIMASIYNKELEILEQENRNANEIGGGTTSLLDALEGWATGGRDLLGGLDRIWNSSLTDLYNKLPESIRGPIKAVYDALPASWQKRIDEWVDGAEEHWKNFKDKLGGWIGDKWNALTSKLSDWAGVVGDKVKEWAGTAWDGIKSAASGAWEGIKSLGSKIGDVASGAWDGIKSVGSKLKDFAGSAWEGIKGVGSKIGELAGSAWEGIKGVSSSAWEGIKSVGSKIGDVASSAWGGITAVGSKMGELAGSAWGGIKSVGSKVGELAGTVGSKIGEVASSAWDGISGVASTVGGKIGDVASSAWGGISGVASTVGGKIGDVASTVGGKIGDVASSAWGGISKVAGGVWEGIGDVGGSLAGAFKEGGMVRNAFGAVTGAMGGVFKEGGVVRNAFGAITGSMGGMFKEGGLINKAFSGFGGMFKEGGLIKKAFGGLKGLFDKDGPAAKLWSKMGPAGEFFSAGGLGGQFLGTELGQKIAAPFKKAVKWFVDKIKGVFEAIINALGKIPGLGKLKKFKFDKPDLDAPDIDLDAPDVGFGAPGGPGVPGMPGMSGVDINIDAPSQLPDINIDSPVNIPPINMPSAGMPGADIDLPSVSGSLPSPNLSALSGIVSGGGLGGSLPSVGSLSGLSSPNLSALSGIVPGGGLSGLSDLSGLSNIVPSNIDIPTGDFNLPINMPSNIFKNINLDGFGSEGGDGFKMPSMSLGNVSNVPLTTEGVDFVGAGRDLISGEGVSEVGGKVAKEYASTQVTNILQDNLLEDVNLHGLDVGGMVDDLMEGDIGAAATTAATSVAQNKLTDQISKTVGGGNVATVALSAAPDLLKGDFKSAGNAALQTAMSIGYEAALNFIPGMQGFGAKIGAQVLTWITMLGIGKLTNWLKSWKRSESRNKAMGQFKKQLDSGALSPSGSNKWWKGIWNIDMEKSDISVGDYTKRMSQAIENKTGQKYKPDDLEPLMWSYAATGGHGDMGGALGEAIAEGLPLPPEEIIQHFSDLIFDPGYSFSLGGRDEAGTKGMEGLKLALKEGTIGEGRKEAGLKAMEIMESRLSTYGFINDDKEFADALLQTSVDAKGFNASRFKRLGEKLAELSGASIEESTGLLLNALGANDALGIDEDLSIYDNFNKLYVSQYTDLIDTNRQYTAFARTENLATIDERDEKEKERVTSRPGRNMTMLAEGGLVTGPTIALVGEAGPEAVIPLDRAGQGSSDLLKEIREMNSMLKAILANPYTVNMDGEKVGTIVNRATSDGIRNGTMAA